MSDKTEKTKIVWISDSPALTNVGQGNVSRECLTRLQKLGYEIVSIGWAHNLVPNPIPLPFPVVHALRQDFLSPDKAIEVVRQAIGSTPQKDVCLILSHDPWLLPVIGNIIHAFPDIKSIGYITINGDPPSYCWYPQMIPYDRLIVPSRFTKESINNRWLDMDIDYVPYGIRHEIFRPEPDKAGMRKKIEDASQGKIQFADKFVGIYIGANQTRKGLGLIHEGWKIFAKNKSDVKMYIFTHSSTPIANQFVGDYDALALVEGSPTANIIINEIPLDNLARILASADVLLHPAKSEGFGLTVYEAMACGTPPVVLNFGALTDICTPENSYICPHFLESDGVAVHHALSTFENLAETLERAYNDKDRNLKGLKGIETVKDFTWERTVEGLHKSIQDVMAYKPMSIRAVQINKEK